MLERPCWGPSNPFVLANICLKHLQLHLFRSLPVSEFKTLLVLKSTLTNPCPPHRPFIADLFLCIFFWDILCSVIWEERTNEHARLKGDHTLADGYGEEKMGPNVEDKSNGSLPATLRVFTCSPLQQVTMRLASFQGNPWPPGSAPSSITVQIGYSSRTRRWATAIEEHNADCSKK